MVLPVQCDIHVHALDTVQTLLDLAAQKLGVCAADAPHLQLVFSDLLAEDREQTLVALGVCNEAQFEIVGYTEGRDGLEDAVMAGRIDAVKAACRHCPERLSHCDKVCVIEERLSLAGREQSAAPGCVYQPQH
eukprot:TRINITY_DN11128_c0_g1_i5.p2 TRINITY_DN11128_c0_g1~~TRINITY_DN11128_c0_g1_i5.p2  ORF type:complete len:133 (+),score=25.49 TRINITY_DN11128_c0_g1_i5:226-624(+)